ncbi:unnamed protein product [Prunus armeniaca]
MPFGGKKKQRTKKTKRRETCQTTVRPPQTGHPAENDPLPLDDSKEPPEAVNHALITRFGAAFMPGPSFGSVVYFTNDGSVKYSIFRMYTKLASLSDLYAKCGELGNWVLGCNEDVGLFGEMHPAGAEILGSLVDAFANLGALKKITKQEALTLFDLVDGSYHHYEPSPSERAIRREMLTPSYKYRAEHVQNTLCLKRVKPHGRGMAIQGLHIWSGRQDQPDHYGTMAN